jgi:hypothetical protein
LKDLDNIVRGISSNEKLFIGRDLNGHVGTTRRRFESVHGSVRYGEKNQEGEEILNFAVAYDFMVANTFKKNLI